MLTQFINFIFQVMPAYAQATVPTAATPSSFPWYLTRAAGLTSLVLLLFLVFMGIGITTGFIFRWMSPITAWTIHRLTALFLVLTIALHLVSLLFDHFVTFHLPDLLIPFHSSYEPTWVGFGVLAFYLFVIILITSLTIIVTKNKLWRLVHYLSYGMVVLVLLHGYFTGTDSKYAAIKLLYLAGVVLVTGLFGYRLIRFRRTNITAHPERLDY